MSSFWNIKNHEKRDAMVEDYIATVKRIQQRSENEKLGSLAQRTLLEETYRPIVRSQEKASKEIVKGLVPIKDEIANLRENLGERKRKIRRVGSEFDGYGPLATNFKRRTMAGDTTLDRSFGIRYQLNGQTVIGKTPVTIQGDNIVVGDLIFKGTPGLWALVTDTKVEQIKEAEPSKRELEEYTALMYQTGALHDNLAPKSSGSWKWKNILGPMWKSIREEEEEEEG